MDPLVRMNSTNHVPLRLKKSIASKIKNISENVSTLERASGLTYPPYFVEPFLTVVEGQDNIGGLGVLYARTRPLDSNGSLVIVVELSAPLILFGTKAFLKVVLAHEMLHYIELVRRFSTLDLVSEITSSSIFEERFEDTVRAVDPSKVYSDKKIVASLRKREKTGFSDEKLNEKVRLNWIEKGLPVVKMPIGSNQMNVSIDSILRGNFDSKVKSLASRL